MAVDGRGGSPPDPTGPAIRVRWAYALTLLAIALAWLWLTAPWWLHGLSIPRDSQNHFYAMFRGLARHLSAGDWPAWMPETHGGRPTLADPQAMVTSPGFLAVAWLDPAPSLRVMDMLVLGHLLLGACVLAVWGLRRGAHPLAAVLAALVFAFGGAAMARLQHTLLVLSYAWLPVVMFAVPPMRPSSSIRAWRWRCSALRTVICGKAWRRCRATTPSSRRRPGWRWWPWRWPWRRYSATWRRRGPRCSSRRSSPA